MSTIINLDYIRRDGGTQSRETIDKLIAADYAQEMADGALFPPVVVFYDGTDYWLADGFHRIEAAHMAELENFQCDVRQGTQRDAILYSVGANSSHGLRRTNDDKRRAVMKLLNDSEWSQWSNREIARRCNVDDKTVAKYREELTAEFRSDDTRTYTTKHGTVATMNTADIGKSKQNVVDFVADAAPDYVKEAVRNRDLTHTQAASLAFNLAGAAEPIQHAAEKFHITEPDTIAELIQLHKRDPELSHIISMSGHIGDTPVTASPLHIREAIHTRSNGNGKVNKIAVLQKSANNEWYTPVEYIHAVHAVMGGIDLDPASNDEANQIVRAASYYTIETDGLAHEWHGRVFLNPPYGKEDEATVTNQELWSSYLIEQFESGITTEAILLVNAVPERKWFQPLWNYLICFTNHRIVFYAPGGEPGQPTHGNAFVYFGSNQQRFAEKFSPFGVVVRRWDDV